MIITKKAWEMLMKVYEDRMDVVHMEEVAHVSMAKVIFAKEAGREVANKEELHDWAEHTHRHNLASILREAPPHITKLFPRRDPS